MLIPPFPSSIHDVTTDWLTSSLRASGAVRMDDEVLDFDVEQVGEGVGFLSHLFRLHLRLSSGQSTTVIAKLPTTTDYLQLAKAVGAYAREIAFYSDVAPRCPLRTPKVHVAEIDSTAEAFVLLMEDLGYLENGDHVAGISFHRAERVIDQLVRLHCWGWGLRSESSAHPAFEPINGAITTGIFSMGVATGWNAYRPKARVTIPDGLAEVIGGWTTHLPKMLTNLAQPVTVINGDLRVDNLFFDGEDEATIVDFQMTMLGAGIWDVAYLVGQGMTTVERAGRERELVRRYVDGLVSAGVTYSFDDAWNQFRIALVAQLTMPLTAGMSWDSLNDRAKELLHALLERAFAIIVDTRAFAALPT